MCVLLKKINVKAITLGFESSSDRVLKYIKNSQNSSVEKNRQAILLGEKYGISIAGGLIIASPTEKIEDMKKNNAFIDFARKHKANRVWIQIMTPFPNTKIWEIAKQRGKVTDDFDDYGNLKNRDKLNWNSLQVHNRDAALLLDDDVPREEFLKEYNYSKKKCSFFAYTVFLKTIIKKPFNLFYFAMESEYYFKRLMLFIKQ